LQNRRRQLLEELVGRYQQCAAGSDVVVVEGLVATALQPGLDTLNEEISAALDAEVILVSAVGANTLAEFNDRLELIASHYGKAERSRVCGCIVNKLNAPRQEVSGSSRSTAKPPAEVLTAESLRERCPIFQRESFHLIGAIPWQQQMVSPRTLDMANHLGADVLYRGHLASRRVVDVSLVARTVVNMLHRLRPDTLLIVPGDRDDIFVAACLAALNGVPLAGVVITGGTRPDERILKFCERALDTGLPVLLVESDSYVTAARAAAMNPEVPVDDLERIERVMDTVAGDLDGEWLRRRCASEREPRLSPAAFMFQLVRRASEAERRIVLPEGTEPRTLQAAAICQQRGIARCVLIGDPREVRRVAEAHGTSLPEDIEIIEPTSVRNRYLRSMVRLRQHKGLTAAMAQEQLEDPVVLGTMMLARGEVDGLVSGAAHTTANTVRPALQLIKTRDDAELVSSIFFMCLPEQVLIYGDCAINPDPNAEELADIAIQSAESALAFGITPRVAMISYSTGASGSGSDVDKVREATRLAKERRPEPDSPVAGRATVLIFPDLNTGNTTYKAVQRSANVVSIGPMLQGLRRPVNDLSRGALVDDIVYTIALTAIQAAQVKEPVTEELH
jgi:phosphate acetyltransferase